MKKICCVFTISLLLMFGCSDDPIIGDSNSFEDIPKGLQASQDRKDSTIHLQWNAVANARGYNLIRTEDPVEGEYHLIAETLEDTLFIDREVTLGTKYYYRVSSVFGSVSDTSVSSEKVWGIALSKSDEDDFPDYISLDAADGEELVGVSVQWSSCGKTAKYDLYVSGFEGDEYLLLKEGITDTLYVHENAVPGPLTYKIIAYNESGDTLKAIDEGYRLVTPKEFFLEINKTYKYSQAKIGLLQNEDLGTESAGGDIHGTLTYSSKLNGLSSADAVLTYGNYKDFYLTLNGKQKTKIEKLIAKKGNVSDTVRASGIYVGFVDHHISVDGGDPNGGYYTVGVEGGDTATVPFSEVKDAVLD